MNKPMEDLGFLFLRGLPEYGLNLQSSMSTMVVYDGEKYYFMYSLQFGIPQTYLIMTFARKLTNPMGKLRLSVK